MATPAPAPSPAPLPSHGVGARLAWADTARGGAMLLVVLAHTVQLLDVSGWSLGVLDPANMYLTAIRMPLFFLISGTFAARAVQRTWPRLFASRIAMLGYVYLLWMLLRAIWFSFVPAPLDILPPWISLLVSPLWPPNGLWFLYALIVYLVLAKATLRLPTWITLPALAVVAAAAASDLLPDGGNWVWHSIMMYGFFFLAGVHGTALWQRLAESANLGWLALALLAIPGATAVFTVLPDPLRGVGRIALSCVCVVACLVIASLVSRWRPLARPFEFIGRRTLPIYVVHAMLLAALVPLLPVDGLPVFVAVLGPVAFVTAVALLLNRWLGPRGGVFSLPKPLAAALTAWADRRERHPVVE
ncbi:acyltransferase family protein [Agromyces sp. MMS24-JH15]|uniref:acyltransferase family protein n=1 Tax=Agromyces sp. MMS24-JH15 TaxID=3243765 RepID=UPI0037488606